MSILNAFSKEALSQVSGISYFANVGLSVKNGDVAVATSMVEAARTAASADWMNIRLEWSNELSRQLAVDYRQEYRQWNHIIEEIESGFRTFAGLRLPKGIRTDLPESILKNVRWDTVEYILERHFSLRIEQHHFSRLIRWYESGRIPCGWEGEYPDGKLIIY